MWADGRKRISVAAWSAMSLPAPCNDTVRRQISQATKRRGSPRLHHAGEGHDAVHLARIAGG